MKTKKKILFISPLPPPNYGSALSSEMCLEIVKSSNALEVRNIKLNFARDISSMGKINFSKILGTFRLKKEIKYQISTFNPDLIYFMPATSNVGLLRDYYLVNQIKKMRKPILFHIRTRINTKNFMLKQMITGERSILLSNLFKKDVSWILKDKDIFILSNAIKNELAASQVKRMAATRTKRASINILFLSNMDIAKGWLKVLDACKLLKKEGVLFNCNFVGAWPSKKEERLFNIKVMNYGLEDNVFFRGQLVGEAKNAVLEASDILVFPTEYKLETFGRVVIEAMMFGLPVISSNTGSLSEVVLNKKTGFILEENSPKEISEKIKILTNKSLARKMGLAGRKIFLAKFEASKYKNQFIKLITSSATQ